MIRREVFVERGQELFVVRRKMKCNFFETKQHLKLFIDEFYTCDHVLEHDGYYLLCDRVDDVKVV